jgi:hypothetical protein
MKKTLLLFLLLLPFFGFSQIDLVKWNAAKSNTNSPTVHPDAVSADIAITDNRSMNYTNNSGENVFYNTGDWPSPAENGGTFNPDKYISLQISAGPNRKLDLSTFNFECRSQGNTNKFRIKYSKDPNFTKDVKDLMTETTSTTTWTAYNPSFLPEINPILPTQTLYIRIYVYSTYNSFQLKIGSVASNGGPTIKGTVSNFDPNSLLAINDYATTTKNEVVNISLISNDVKGSSNINGLTITTKPNASEGTVTVNPDYSATFNPTLGYIGNTSFTYTITNSTQSSTGTVYVTVKDRQEENLALWNGASSSFNPVLSSAVTSGPIAPSGGVGLGYKNNSGSNIFFETSNWPKPEQNGGSFDPVKYITFKISPDQNHKIDLTSFNFTYRRNGGNNEGQKFKVLYSKDETFITNVKTFVAETPTTSSWITSNNVFASDLSSLIPNETMYIRFYVYNTNNDFFLQNGNGNSVGPVIRGYVRSINSLAAYDDSATTEANKPVTISNLDNDVIAPTPLQTMVISTQSSNGTAVANGLKDITFTPAAGFTGTTTFIYTIFNGTSYSSATVTVTVTAPPCIATLTPGINRWKGYVYTYTGDIPAMTTYVGSIAENPNFDRNIDTGTITGDATVEADAFCGTVPSDRFYVRYLMQTTTEAGTYNFTIGADDGVRLFIDNVLVTVTPTGSWGDHGYNKYTAQYTFNTAGTHTFMLEYYEKAGASRISFLYGLVKGDQSLPYGDNVWNVFGFTQADLNLDNVKTSYAGTYVDPNVNLNSESYWNKKLSPSSSAEWKGAPIQIDNFTLTHRRQGFPCGDYQIQVVNNDDVTEIRIDDVLIFTRTYSTGSVLVEDGKTYSLNKNSRVEIRLREDAGDANVNVKFIPVETIYNGTGPAPTGVTAITISGNTTLQSDIEVCSCTIKAGATLIIPADKTLTVNENITVATGGKLLVQNGGSLLQNNTSKTMFSGDVNSFELQRTSAPVRRYDFTFWSSPVTAESKFTLKKLSPATLADKYYSYDTKTGAWKISYNGILVMTPGDGYIVRAPQNYNLDIPAAYNASFFGIPNNGDILVTPVATHSYLLGNPYPSAIDADKLIKINSLAGNDIGALYFWTHNSPPSDAVSGDAKYNYTVNDYAVYSLTGGVATGPAKTGGSQPTGKIAAGQAFFATPSTNLKVKFTNDMRIPANNKQFFKTDGSDENEKNRIWLNFTNAKGAFKQVLVGYVDGATNEWDTNYDGWTMSGNTYLDFYSINDDAKLTVQGRALPFEKTDLVPLGYVTSIAGDFTIAIDHVDGVFNNQAIYLEDKKTGQIIDLRAGNYTFTTAIGTFPDRFVLRYTNKTLGTDGFENIENGVLVSVKDKIIKVLSSKEIIKEVSVYDITGKLLYDKKKVNSTELQLSNLQSDNQVLIVKVTLDNDFIVSKKVVL